MPNDYIIFYIIFRIVLGGFIGAFIGLIAIRMLFRPYNEKLFIGHRVPFTPGILPKRKDEIAESIAKSIDEHLFTKENLVTLLLNDHTKNEIKFKIKNYLNELEINEVTLDEFIRRYLNNEQRENLVEKIEDVIVDGVMSSLPSGGLLGIITSKFEFLARNNVRNKKSKILNSKISDLLSDLTSNYKESIANMILKRYIDLVQNKADDIIPSIKLADKVEGKIKETSEEKIEEVLTKELKDIFRYIVWVSCTVGAIVALVTLFI